MLKVWGSGFRDLRLEDFLGVAPHVLRIPFGGSGFLETTIPKLVRRFPKKEDSIRAFHRSLYEDRVCVCVCECEYVVASP